MFVLVFSAGLLRTTLLCKINRILTFFVCINILLLFCFWYTTFYIAEEEFFCSFRVFKVFTKYFFVLLLTRITQIIVFEDLRHYTFIHIHLQLIYYFVKTFVKTKNTTSNFTIFCFRDTLTEPGGKYKLSKWWSRTERMVP